MTEARKRRRERLIELVELQTVTNQEQLQSLLRDEGINATQATISRDLRDLGITKGASGYVRLSLNKMDDSSTRELCESLRNNVLSITPAATLLVVRTIEGQASHVGKRIERASLPQCIGVMIGENSVFIATRSVGQASELARVLEHIMRQVSSEAI